MNEKPIILFYADHIYSLVNRGLELIRKVISISFFTLLAVFLSGCVATYKAADDGAAGYRELRIDKNTYYVEYTEASSRIDWDQLKQFALRRAAELAKRHGYDAFDVLDSDEKLVSLKSDVSNIVVSTPGNAAWDPPVSNSYELDGRVEGKRVTYKVRFVND